MCVTREDCEVNRTQEAGPFERLASGNAIRDLVSPPSDIADCREAHAPIIAEREGRPASRRPMLDCMDAGHVRYRTDQLVLAE